MNDEGYLSVEEEMEGEGLCSKSGEGLHLVSDSNGTLGLGGDLLSTKPRAGDAKMGEEEKNSGSKRRSKPIEVRVDSDDDEPIGSLFNLKKPRNPKRAKSGLDSGKVEQVVVRAENSMVEEEDSGEMDDTLANFRKKLKGPKMGKDGGSGGVKGKDSALNVAVTLGQSSHKPLKDGVVVAKLPAKLVEQSPTFGVHGLDLPLDGVLEDRPKSRGKRSRRASIPKKMEEFDDGLDQQPVVRRSRGTLIQKKKVLGFNETRRHSSDENLEVSLSVFRKLQSGTVRKARSSFLRKQKGEAPASGDDLSRRSEEVQSVITLRSRSASALKLTSKIPQSEGVCSLDSSGSQIDPVPVLKEAVETLRSDADLSRASDWVQESSYSHPVQKLASALKTDIVRSDDNRYDKLLEGISDDPVLVPSLPGSHSGFIADMEENSSILCDVECDKHIKMIPEGPVNHESLNQLNHGASEDLLSGEIQDSCPASSKKLTEETQRFQDGLKQCSKGKTGDFVCDIVEKSCFNSVSKQVEGIHVSDTDGPSGLLIKIPEVRPSPTALWSAEESSKSHGALDETTDAVKTTGEAAGSNVAFDQSAVGVPEIFHSTTVQEPCFFPTPGEEIPASCHGDDCLNKPSEETCTENTIGRNDCLNQPCESTFEKLRGHVEKLSTVPHESQNKESAGYDELFHPFGKILENSLTYPVQNPSLSSIPVKLEDIPKPEVGLDQFSDGFSKDFQPVLLDPLCSAFGSAKKEEAYKQCDVTNQTPGTSIGQNHHALVFMQTEDTSTSDDRLCAVSLTSDVVKKIDSVSAVNHKEESPTIADVLNPFPDGILIDSVASIQKVDQPSEDVFKGVNVPYQDSICVKEEAKGTCSPSIATDLEEIYPEDAEMARDPEDKDKKLSVMQRAMRKIKKHRHGDMAYEGDTDWEVLMHEQGFFENNRVLDGDRPSRMKDKSDSPSIMVAEADNGVAAVAAGLKARAAGPVEKIKFKEVLKRRGGLQEYLECRNLILGLWSKDMSCILPLVDCGVTDVPSKDETPRASLIREIYEFLDHSGYINVGIASEKEKSEPHAKVHYELSKEKIPTQNCGAQVADSEDGVTSILGRVESSKILSESKNSMLFDDGKLISEATEGGKLVLQSTGSELSNLIHSEECTADNDHTHGFMDALSIDPSTNIMDGGPDFFLAPEQIKHSYGVQSAVLNPVEENDNMQCDSGLRKRIIVVGAGPAGLTAARHLQRQGFSVIVLEARNRMGGRVYTDRSSLSVPVDLGASIITGVEADVATERRPDPSSLVCAQLGLELTVLNSDCPLYDIVTGQKVPADLDEALEAEYNSLLDDMLVLVAQKGEHAVKMSLEDGLEYALKRRRIAQSGTDAEEFELHTWLNDSIDTGTNGFSDKIPKKTSSKDEILSPLERRVMDWHFANLEYGCAALLKAVSLPYWNQDDVYGGFGGAHCMIKGGYSTVVESLGKGLNVHMNHVVNEVSYSTIETRENGERWRKVKVSTSNGSDFVGDAVLITVPLGCLKADTIKFSPALPDWKRSSIQRLGFGVLNKVVLEFPQVFWDDTVDYFGTTSEETDRRGQCFMFWNVKKTVGAPVLIALVVGKAALDGQNMSSSDHVNHAVMVLRKLFGEALVPDPVASVVTNWGRDPFSRGAYSYVAVGSSGEDYDILGRPVENCLFFAGEATCKEHPDTVGGAMMSGLREAVRIIDILSTGNDYRAEVEAMEAAQRRSDSERNEIRDILKRLDAIKLSSVLDKSSLDGDQMLTKVALLRDMFFNAKTTAGRLHLAKELLNLPVEALKSFAGTKEGLSTLNSWILDSMGKDGTQLLRHCVRLLVLVSTDLLAVRLSGIGRTVKEKVCVHTSRDIRAVASQLVSVWIEVFRKEKAANGRLKLLRQTTVPDSSKAKSSKDLSLGKPPLRTSHGTPDNRGTVQDPSSAGSHSPSNVNNKNNKKPNCKPFKMETVADLKSEVNSSRSQGVVQGPEYKVAEENHVAMSEEEAAAFAAAEAAREAALAAAQAYASSEAECSTLRELPKIPSFHKFARREQYAQMDDSDLRRRKWPGGVLGRQDCISEIDSRNCRVRNWSVDFSATCANLDSSRILADNYTQRSHSNEVVCQLNPRELSGESAGVDSSFVKAWVDSAGSGGVKDYHDIERWQSQAAAADSDCFHSTSHIRDEEDSNATSKLPSGKHERRAEESSASQVTGNKVLIENQAKGAERIKQAVVDYVASLLMPLYKARKIDKEGYKLIMKKSATKVMEQTMDAEKAMSVSEFLDFKRKNKIRSFVDKLIERHMATNPVVKS